MRLSVVGDFRQFGKILIFLAALWLCEISYAQAPATEMGTVKGTVQYDDGIPYCGQMVVNKQPDNAQSQFFETFLDGTFQVTLPVGEWLGNVVNGSTLDANKINVIAGGTIQFNFTIPRRQGIVLTVKTPDGKNVQDTDIKVSGGWQVLNRDPVNEVDFSRLPDGRFWLSRVPSNCSAFHVIVRRSDVIATAKWQFDAPDPKRTLTMTVPFLGQIAVRVCNAQGQPQPNTPLRVIFARQGVSLDKVIPERQSTDNRGILRVKRYFTLGERYSLIVQSVDASGSTQSFNAIALDATEYPDYPLSLCTRDVKQRIFYNDAAPAVKRDVCLSYCWDGKMILRKGRTDPNGYIVWVALPPVPAMVWGKGIPVGELPVDAAVVRAPLPVPAAGPDQSYSFVFTMDGSLSQEDAVKSYAIQGLAVEPIDSALHVEREAQRTHIRILGNGHAGTAVTILLCSDSVPVRFALLFEFYLPRGSGELMIPASVPLVKRLRLLSPRGTPIQVVNPFKLVPDDADRFAKLWRAMRPLPPALPAPKAVGNGVYEMAFPWPGDYRLCVDGYHSTSLAPTAFRLIVDDTPAEITIKMPEPLVQVSPDTIVYCLPLCAPTKPEQYIAPPGAVKTPIYVNKTTLLAYWYQTTPETMVLWQASDLEQPAREIPKRDIEFANDMKRPLLLLTQPVPAMKTRNLELLFPDGEAFRKLLPCLLVTDNSGAYRIAITNGNQLIEIGRKKSLLLTIPINSQLLTLQLFGVGIVRDVDVSNVMTTVITLPAWQTGVPCAGNITMADGKPFVGKVIVYPTNELRPFHTTTDAQGKFDLPGVLPGIHIFKTEVKPYTTWQVDIPVTGDSNLALAIPMAVREMYVQPYSPKSLWWLPDDQPSKFIQGKMGFADLPIGEGWIWQPIDEAQGIWSAQRFTLASAENPAISMWDNAFLSSNTVQGPSLGIILSNFPFTTRPRSITLVGLKQRAYINIYVATPRWEVNPTLHCIATTLEGIPPGDYLLTIHSDDSAINGSVTVTSLGGYIHIRH